MDWDSLPLGQMADAALAEIVGVSSGQVRYARLERGIPSWRSMWWVDWGAIDFANLTNAEIARWLGISEPAVNRRRPRIQRARSACWSGINWEGQPLGNIPDTALANHLGLSACSVRQQRVKRGIPSWKSRHVTHLAHKIAAIDIPEDKTDTQIARDSNIPHISYITRERKRRGVVRSAACFLCLVRFQFTGHASRACSLCARLVIAAQDHSRHVRRKLGMTTRAPRVSREYVLLHEAKLTAIKTTGRKK